MTKKYFFIFIALIFLFIGCDTANSFKDGSSSSEKRVFNAVRYNADATETTPLRIEATKVSDSPKLEIYFATNKKSVYDRNQATINNVKNLYNTHIKRITDTFGELSDFDENGKLILFFYDLHTPETAGAYVAGFFNENDLFKNQNSNLGEIIYLNTYMLEMASPASDLAITDTVFHETQHAINANREIENTYYTDLWLNEALSESAYFVFTDGKVNAERLQVFNNTIDYAINIHNGLYFYTWRGEVSNYVTASLFMYWLYAQNDSMEILKNIASSTKSGYEAVESAAQAANIINKSENWNNLFAAWLEANFKNEPSGLYGYNGKLGENKISVFQAEGKALKLYPGDAVYTSTSYTPPVNPYITYKDISKGLKTWRLIYNPSTEIADKNTETAIIKPPAGSANPAQIRERSAADTIPYYIPVDRIIRSESH